VWEAAAAGPCKQSCISRRSHNAPVRQHRVRCNLVGEGCRIQDCAVTICNRSILASAVAYLPVFLAACFPGSLGIQSWMRPGCVFNLAGQQQHGDIWILAGQSESCAAGFTVRKRLGIEEGKAVDAVVLHPQPQTVQDEAPHHRMPAIQHPVAPVCQAECNSADVSRGDRCQLGLEVDHRASQLGAGCWHTTAAAAHVHAPVVDVPVET
jgi:hypothetical protein